MSQSILGLDIGRNRIKAVRLDTTFKGFEAVTYAEHELPPEPPPPPGSHGGERPNEPCPRLLWGSVAVCSRL